MTFSTLNVAIIIEMCVSRSRAGERQKVKSVTVNVLYEAHNVQKAIRLAMVKVKHI